MTADDWQPIETAPRDVRANLGNLGTRAARR